MLIQNGRHRIEITCSHNDIVIPLALKNNHLIYLVCSWLFTSISIHLDQILIIAPNKLKIISDGVHAMVNIFKGVIRLSFSVIATRVLFYISFEVEHIYACRQDCASSIVVTFYQHSMCFAVCWWRVDRFRNYCRVIRQKTHTQMIL